MLIVVLLGVFSFVAYKKWGQLRLHPGAEVAGTEKGDVPVADAKSPSSDANSSAAAANAQTPVPQADPFQTADEARGARNGARMQSALAQPKAAEAEHQPVPSNPFGDLSSNQSPEQPTGPHRIPNAPSTNPAAALMADGARDIKEVPAEKPTGPGTELAARQHNPFDGEDARAEASKPQNAASGLPRSADPFPAINPQAGLHSVAPASMPGQNSLAAAMAAPATHAQNPNAPVQSLPAQTQNPPAQGEPVQSEPAVTLQDEEPKQAIVAKAAVPRVESANAGSAFQPNGLPQQREPAPQQREPATVAGEANASPMASLDSEQPTSPGGATLHSAQASSTTTIRPSPPAAARFNEGTRPNEDAFASRPTPAPSQAAAMGQEQLADANGTPGSTVIAAGASDDSYIVSPQDNFWTISRKKYGTSRYFLALAEVNKARIPNPTLMRPGVKVITPPAAILETQYAQLLPKGTVVRVPGVASSPPARGAGFFVGPDGRPMYRTGETDTLSSIAEKHLGRSSRSMQIFQMNRDKLSDPNRLKPGIELQLPGDASNVTMLDQNDDRR